MAETPPFTVLLPVYGGDSPAFLRRAFDSAVGEQILRPNEVVLVQDGPVAEEMSTAIRALISTSTVPVEHVVIPDNQGLANALTIGLEHCSHDVVARMDADDVSEPERFSVQLPLIARGFELVGSGMTEFVEDQRGVEALGQLRTPPSDEQEIRRYARFHDPFNHPTVVYDKRAVARAGGYEPLGLMEDYWLFARMLLGNTRATNVPIPLVRYRVSSGAYKRRGGLQLLSSEWQLQRAFRRSRFTTRGQFLRNIVLRCGYRLIPVGLRTMIYRRFILTPQQRSAELK